MCQYLRKHRLSTRAALAIAGSVCFVGPSYAQTLDAGVGNNFTNATQIGTLGGSITQMAFDPKDPNHLYVTTWFGGVQRYDYNANGTISNKTQVVPDSVVNVNGANGSYGIAFHDDPTLGSVMYLSPAQDNTGGTQQGLSTIVRLTDTNGDGTWGNHATDVNQTIVNDLYVARWTHQIDQLAIHNNSLYVTIGSMTDDGGASGASPGESAHTGAVSFIQDLTQLSGDTSTANLAGFNMGVDDGQTLSAADVAAYKTDTQMFTSTDPGKLRVYATGFRNGFGISVAPNGEVWVSNNQTQNPSPEDELHLLSYQSDHGYAKENDVVGDWKDPNNTHPSAQAAQAAGYFQGSESPVALLGTNTAVTGLDFITAPGNDYDGFIVVTRAANNNGARDVVLVDPSDGSVHQLVLGGTAGRPTDALIDPYGNLILGANSNQIVHINVTGGIGNPLGDLNGDFQVDEADLAIILGRFGQAVSAGSFNGGDPTGDGAVGLDDLNVILRNWTSSTPPSTTIPEPGSFALLAGLTGLTLRRRRR